MFGYLTLDAKEERTVRCRGGSIVDMPRNDANHALPLPVYVIIHEDCIVSGNAHKANVSKNFPQKLIPVICHLLQPIEQR
jgi:hypothetical protein